MRLEEANTFFKSIKPQEKKYRILLLLIGHGCRPHEAIALHVSDFVRADCTHFYVNNCKVVRKDQPPRRDPKYLPIWVAKEVKEYIEECYRYGQLKGGYLFCTNKPGKYCHMQTCSFITWFSRRRKRLGFTETVDQHNANGKLKAKGIEKVFQYRIQIYSFRRLFATELAKSGVDQRKIALMMGHSDTRTTSQYQDKVQLLEDADNAIAKMPRFFEAGQEKLQTYI